MPTPNDRLQNAVEVMLDKVERDTLRPLRRDGFMCSAKCCENGNSSMEELQRCVTACQQKSSGAENVMSQELRQFQERVQRSAMQCTDAAQAQLPADGTQPDAALMAKLEGQVTNCVNKCIDTHIATLDSLGQRVTSAIKRL